MNETICYILRRPRPGLESRHAFDYVRGLDTGSLLIESTHKYGEALRFSSRSAANRTKRRFFLGGFNVCEVPA